MIKSELDFVWITTDGKRFLSKLDAFDHEKELEILTEDVEEKDLAKYEKFLEDEWELTDNGSYGIVGSYFKNHPPKEYKVVKKEQEKRKKDRKKDK